MTKRLSWIIVLCAIALLGAMALFVRYPADGRVETEKNQPQKIEGFLFDRFEIAQVYFDRSSWVQDRTIPYKDVLEEYPQIGVLYFSIPRFFTDSRDVFMRTIVAMNCILWILTIGICISLLKALALSRLRILIFLLPSFVYFTIARYDILPVALVLASLLALQKKYLRSAALLLVLAIFAKWYAIILVPFFMSYAVSAGFSARLRKQAWLLGGGLFCLIMGVTFALAGLSTLYPYGVHIGRILEIGGLYTVFMQVIFSIIPNQFDGAVLSSLSPVVFLLQFFGLALGILLYRRLCKVNFTFDLLLRFCIFAIGIFVLAGKFYSGQWELWWIVIAALVVRGKWEWALLVASDVLNYIQVPLVYRTIGPYSFVSDLVVVLRSLALALLLAMLVKPLVQLVRDSVRKPPQSTQRFATRQKMYGDKSA